MRSIDVVAEALETKYLISPVDGCCATINHIGAEGNTLMTVEVEITGDGKWELVDDVGAEIRFDAHSRCMTGDVEIRKGTWHANKFKVFTTGDLTMAPPGVIKLTGTGSTASAATRVKFSKTVWGGCP